MITLTEIQQKARKRNIEIFEYTKLERLANKIDETELLELLKHYHDNYIQTIDRIAVHIISEYSDDMQLWLMLKNDIPEDILIDNIKRFDADMQKTREGLQARLREISTYN
jgi:hypothetical protein